MRELICLSAHSSFTCCTTLSLRMLLHEHRAAQKNWEMPQNNYEVISYSTIWGPSHFGLWPATARDPNQVSKKCANLTLQYFLRCYSLPSLS